MCSQTQSKAVNPQLIKTLKLNKDENRYRLGVQEQVDVNLTILLHGFQLYQNTSNPEVIYTSEKKQNFIHYQRTFKKRYIWKTR